VLEPLYTISGRTSENGYHITAATVTADFGKNGYRLPTDTQWEYACRAGSTGNYSKDILGIEIASTNLGEYAWYIEKSNSRTHEVGKKTANAFGLYDMHGNVVEWEQINALRLRGVERVNLARSGTGKIHCTWKKQTSLSWVCVPRGTGMMHIKVEWKQITLMRL